RSDALGRGSARGPASRLVRSSAPVAPRRRMTKDTFYITTPIYYVNAEPHVGSAYTTVIADVIARWHRLHGEKVHFLTGVDEHGAKQVKAAEEAGMTPQAYVDAMAPHFVKTWKALDISND